MVFAALVGLSATGCTLPTQTAAGVSVMIPHEGPARFTPEIRSGFHPLQLVGGLEDRPADVGAGVVVRWTKPGTPLARPLTEIYVEGTGIELDREPGQTDYARRSYGGAVTFWPGRKPRIGAEAIFKQEIGLFLHEEQEKTYAHGELTIGLYAGVAVDTKKVTISGGVLVRTPFAATIDIPDRM